jgi:hypothetical protein
LHKLVCDFFLFFTDRILLNSSTNEINIAIEVSIIFQKEIAIKQFCSLFSELRSLMQDSGRKIKPLFMYEAVIGRGIAMQGFGAKFQLKVDECGKIGR